MSILALTMAAATAAVPGAGPDPLVPAREGKVQCYEPGMADKTCASFGAYRFLPDGTIINDAWVMIAREPPVSIRTSDPVTVRDGRICGYLGPVEDMEILVAGEPANEKIDAYVRSELRKGMAQTAGKEICSAYRWEGAWFLSSATVDGIPKDSMAKRVIWVHPNEGYRLGAP